MGQAGLHEYSIQSVDGSSASNRQMWQLECNDVQLILISYLLLLSYHAIITKLYLLRELLWPSPFHSDTVHFPISKPTI